MKFETKYLSDVVFFQEGPGVRKFQFRDRGVKLLNVGNINKGKLNTTTTKLYISNEEAYGKYKHFLVDEGDLLIASSGIVVDNFHNKIAYAKKEDLPLCLNTSTIRFKLLNKKLFCLDYLKFYLKTNHFKNQLRKLITGAAQLNFGPSHLKKIILPVPSLEDQIQIANILSTAEMLVEERKKSIELLDESLRSSFSNMFGNPVTNTKLFKKEKLKEFTIFLTSGGRGWNKYYSKKGMRFIRSFDVQMNSISNEDAVYVIPPNNQEAKRTEVKPNDVLLTVTGSKIGRVTTVPKGFGISYVSQHVAIIRLKNILPLYLSYYLSDPNCGQYLIGRNQYGQTKPGLNFSQIEGFEILNPPLELQNEFAIIVSKVEIVKEQYKNSLLKLENLYDSLSQQLFNGDLHKTKEAKLIPIERKVLAGRIIQLFNDNPIFGVTMFQKNLHVCEYFAEVDYETYYAQNKAGPDDRFFMQSFLQEMAEKDWFHQEQKYKLIRFVPGEHPGELTKKYADYFRDKGKKIIFALQLMKGKTLDEAELISTLYAVWNNKIIRNEKIDLDGLVTDVYNWSEEKSKYRPDEIKGMYYWMNDNKLIPVGFGKEIMKS